MKLGLMTAALPAMSLEEITRWAAESRFGMLEIACWPVGKKDRRYGGVSHIDVTAIDAGKAREINFLIDQMDESERRTYLVESLFLNTVKYENDKLEAYMKRLAGK